MQLKNKEKTSSDQFDDFELEMEGNDALAGASPVDNDVLLDEDNLIESETATPSRVPNWLDDIISSDEPAEEQAGHSEAVGLYDNDDDLIDLSDRDTPEQSPLATSDENDEIDLSEDEEPITLSADELDGILEDSHFDEEEVLLLDQDSPGLGQTEEDLVETDLLDHELDQPVDFAPADAGQAMAEEETIVIEEAPLPADEEEAVHEDFFSETEAEDETPITLSSEELENVLADADIEEEAVLPEPGASAISDELELPEETISEPIIEEEIPEPELATAEISDEFELPEEPLPEPASEEEMPEPELAAAEITDEFELPEEPLAKPAIEEEMPEPELAAAEISDEFDLPEETLSEPAIEEEMPEPELAAAEISDEFELPEEPLAKPASEEEMPEPELAAAEITDEFELPEEPLAEPAIEEEMPEPELAAAEISDEFELPEETISEPALEKGGQPHKTAQAEPDFFAEEEEGPITLSSDELEGILEDVDIEEISEETTSAATGELELPEEPLAEPSPAEKTAQAESDFFTEEEEGPITLSNDELEGILEDADIEEISEETTPSGEETLSAEESQAAMEELPELPLPEEPADFADETEEISEELELPEDLFDEELVEEPKLAAEPAALQAQGEDFFAEEEEGPITLSSDELEGILEDVNIEEEPAEISGSDKSLELLEQSRVLTKESPAEEQEIAEAEEISEDYSALPENEKAMPEELAAPADNLPEREELRNVLGYLDTLLGELPDDVIEEFAHSEYFKLYQNVMEKLGL